MIKTDRLYDSRVYHFNQTLIARNFSQAAMSYHDSAQAQAQAGQKLIELLPNTEVHTAIDIGAGTGRLSKVLTKKFPKSFILSLDLAENMLSQIQAIDTTQIIPLHGDMNYLPCSPQSLDLALANMSLQWSQNIEHTLTQIHGALRPGGLLACTLPGPKTLCELRQSWQQIDDATHVNQFATKSSLIKHLKASGFRIQSINTEYYQLKFSSLIEILKHLKLSGAHHVWDRKLTGLMGRNKLQRLEEIYRQFSDEPGKLPCTYEIIFIIAYKD